jgi:hypothetical protein
LSRAVTENGLTPAIVNGTAGDLILFDTALFQCVAQRCSS